MSRPRSRASFGLTPTGGRPAADVTPQTWYRAPVPLALFIIAFVLSPRGAMVGIGLAVLVALIFAWPAALLYGLGFAIIVVLIAVTAPDGRAAVPPAPAPRTRAPYLRPDTVALLDPTAGAAPVEGLAAGFTPVGRNERDDWRFRINMTPPDPLPDDTDATPAQMSAITAFYDCGPNGPPSLSRSQAHALLCYRDYARAVVDEISPGIEVSVARAVAQYLAAFISGDSSVALEVVAWSRRARNGRGGTGARDMRHFARVADEAATFAGYMARLLAAHLPKPQ